MNYKIVLLLISLTSLPLMADELDFQTWQDLNVMAQKNQQMGFLPTTLQPVTSKEGVYQQVLNYNLQQLKTTVPVAGRVVNTNFNGQWGDQTQGSQTTFQFRPIDSKASVNFQNTVTASMNYQVWNRQYEAKLTPNRKIMGMNLAISHLSTPIDQQNRVVVMLEW